MRPKNGDRRQETARSSQAQAAPRTLIGFRRICGGRHHVTEGLVGLLRQERCRQCAGMRHVRLRSEGDAATEARRAHLPSRLACAASAMQETELQRAMARRRQTPANFGWVALTPP